MNKLLAALLLIPLMAHFNLFAAGDEYPYDKAWKQVDSLENKGLPRSALEAVEKIYAAADEEQNDAQLVKALIHVMKYHDQIEEKSDSMNLVRMNRELERAQFPRKQLLHSMLADMYFSYYQNHRWQLYDRTAISVTLDDFQTWDAATFFAQSSQHYLASLAPAAELQQRPIADYAPLLVKQKESERYRPTLFDLLAHRAIDFYSNTDTDLPEPAYRFELSAEAGLAPVAEFANASFPTPDSASRVYQAVRIYQQLLRFHLADKEPYALIDADLKRLKYAKEKAIGEGKDQRYLETLQSLQKRYEKHPASADVQYEIALQYLTWGNSYEPLAGDAHKWDKKTALALCEQAILDFPKSRGAEKCQSLKARILSHSLSLQAEDVNLARQPFRLRLDYKNLDRVWFRVIENSEKLQKKLEKIRYYEQDKRLEAMLREPVLKAWDFALTDDGDYQNHATEVKAPGLGFGEYIVLVSDNKAFSIKQHAVAYTHTRVSNLTCLEQQIEGVYHHYLLDRNSGEAIPNIVAREYVMNRNDRKFVPSGRTFTTDPNGHVAVSPAEQSQFYLEFTVGADKMSTQQRYTYRNSAASPVAHPRIVFFTDRKIYRPGQTIYFKGLAMEQTGDAHKILPGREVKVQFLDVNYQQVAEQAFRTNEYGTFSGTFTAPSGGLLGNMQLQTEGGSTDFSVEEYKRPKFEVRFDDVKGSFQLGDTVRVSGKATAFTGANIDGAEVRYRVVREPQFPFWFSYFWWRPRPQQPPMEILNGTAITDENGAFEVEFAALPDKTVLRENKPVFHYIVYADVIDITGETHSSSQTVRIGYIGLSAEIRVPELLSTDTIPAFVLTTENLNGVFEPAIGTVKIIPLKDPGIAFRGRRWSQVDRQVIAERDYRREFPYDVYGNEDDFRNWEAGEASLIRSFDTESSKELRIPEIARLKPGKFKLLLSTKDKAGNEIEVVRFFTLNNPADKLPAVTSLLSYRLDRAQAEPGETVELLLGTTEKSLPLIYQVIREGQVIDQLHLNLQRGQETISIPVQESWRGNVQILLAYARHNSYHIGQQTLVVPWSNKELKLEWMTFRSELQPGQKEQWKLKISGPKAEQVSAEMVAAMYDASLDQFRSNSFDLSLYATRYHRVGWSTQGYGSRGSDLVENGWNPSFRAPDQGYDAFNWFDFYFGQGGYGRRGRMVEMQSMAYYSMPASAPAAMARDGEEVLQEATMMSKQANDTVLLDQDADGVPDLEEQIPPTPPSPDLDQVAIRTNLNETAFFFPHLETNPAGEIVLDFTIPEALTKWKFLGLAHTKDLEIGALRGETVTKKDLMVVPNVPRFLREGDRITFTAKVVNLSEKELTGEAKLDLLDAFSMQEVNGDFGNGAALRTFTVPAGQSSLLSWDLTVPKGAQALATRVIAKAGEFSDGEENVLPVLTNRILVTESLPLPINGKGKKTFAFQKLLDSGNSSTLTHQKLTLEFTSNPAWYAVQALPYLMEYPHDCTEQIFSRFYANALATHIANSSPRINQVFRQWREQAADDVLAKQSLLSNLEKNQELKSVLLQETPWVLDARAESERKQRVGLLFDLNRMADELGRARQKLSQLQNGNGAFSWFAGMPDSRYITTLVVNGMGHLNKLGVSYSGDPEMANMISRAIPYLDGQLAEDYRRLKSYKNFKPEENHLSHTQIQYLYMRSFFIDIPMANGSQDAFAYYYGQAKTFWTEQSNYMKGMLALTFHRYQDEAVAKEVIASLKENAVFNEEQGMYWKYDNGFYWYQAPIETQALLIEAFNDVTGDIESVESMKVWLLKNKQTNDWKTTRATVAACNALLATGLDVLESNELVEVSLGNEKVDPFERADTRLEAGTGYFKTAWVKEEISPKMGHVTLRKKDRGVAWGALYWQYFEDLDKITYAQTPLSLRKELFIEKPSDKGPVLEPITADAPLQPGDKLKVRIELRVDRDMEYVHMKDMRAAGFEPINVFSSYKYQGGLGYYESTKDAATHFFFDFLPKGTWVFEYPLRVNHAGDFSNGITTIQCMYAPEFTSHSAGIRVQVEK